MRYKASRLGWPWQWRFEFMKVKFNCTNGLPIHTFLLIFNSNIWPYSVPLRDIMLRNLRDLDSDLSRSLRSNVICTNGLPTYVFLLMLNSNIWTNIAVTRYNASKSEWSWLEIDLDLKFQCHWRSHVRVFGHPIYGFLMFIRFISNIWPNSAPLWDVSSQHLSKLDKNLWRSLKSNVIAPKDSHICFPIYV